MFCKVCGAELRPDVDFCIKCGEKVPKKKDEVEAPAQEEAVEQTAQPAQQKETVEQSAQSTQQEQNVPVQQVQPIQQSAPIYNVSREEVSSSKTWMVIGLVCNIINLIPYLNVLTFIPSIICTILGMNKVVNLLGGVEDEQAQKFYRGTKLVRLNYIICILLAIVMFFGGIIIAVAIGMSSQNSDPEMAIKAFTVILILVAGLFSLYYYGILIWALVQWIRLNDFLGKLAR